MLPIKCPNCQKTNLTRCKILRQNDPDYGKEYDACSVCPSKWFTDDPNRPQPDPDAKKKKSLWEKLGTWGAPTLPEGVNHHATYIFPPVHDYPQILLPVTGNLKPRFVKTNHLSTPAPSQDPQPKPQSKPPSPETQPPPPEEIPVPAPAPSPPPEPAVPQATPEPPPPEPVPQQVPQDEDQIHQPEPEPLPEPEPTAEKLAAERARVDELLMKFPESPGPPPSNHSEPSPEERALNDLLTKVINSPVPAPSAHSVHYVCGTLTTGSHLSPAVPGHLTRDHSPIPERLPTPACSLSCHHHPPSPGRSESQHEAGHSPTPIEDVLAREQTEQLREKLIKVAQTPLPASPLPHNDPSIHQVSFTPLPTHTPVIPNLDEEVNARKEELKMAEKLREKLIKIVQIPLPYLSPSAHPASVPAHTPIDPKIDDDDQNGEKKISEYAERISRRLDQAISTSPFLKAQDYPWTPKTSLASPSKTNDILTSKASGSSSLEASRTLKPRGLHGPSTHKASNPSSPKIGSSHRPVPSGSTSVVSHKSGRSHRTPDECPLPGSFAGSPCSSHPPSLPNPPIHICSGMKSRTASEKGKARCLSIAESSSPCFG